jgi:hypothetical protein
MDRIIQIRDNYYIESGQASVIDSTKFMDVEVWRTWANGGTVGDYWNQKYNLRYYEPTATSPKLGDHMGTLRIYDEYDLHTFMTWLDTVHVVDFSMYGEYFPMLESYYQEFVTEGGETFIFKVYLNHENQWWESGDEGAKTLFYNQEWLQFVPLGSTYVDTANNNFNMDYLGDLAIKEGGPISVEGWFIYFNAHKYDSL